jgi:hypothetical protein
MRKTLTGIIARSWPLAAAVGILLVTTAVLLISSVAKNQGHLVYALDDAYIHMAIAKNVALHGVWGVTRYGFSSCSSSLLWTLVLSATYVIVAVSELAPLILNVVFATALVWLVHTLLRKRGFPAGFRCVVLLSIVFLTPLPALIFSGMEHILHTLVTVSFVYLSAEALSREELRKGNALSFGEALLLLLSPLVIMVRYEGMFLVVVVCILFLARKRFLLSLGLGGLGILPVTIYGLISVSKGWLFLPNSVLLKGNMPSLFSIKALTLVDYSRNQQVIKDPQILILILAASILFLLHYEREKRIWKSPMIMNIIFIATTLLHIQFARTGYFFRYEAYLIALGIVVIALSLGEYVPGSFSIKIDRFLVPRYLAIAGIVFLAYPFALSPFLWRGVDSLRRIPQATANIYEQQYQMGLFLSEYYQGATVAAHDIGAINFLADIKCVDLAGLGSMEVAAAKRESGYFSQEIFESARNKAKIAIVYDEILERYVRIPPEWIQVGRWAVTDNVALGHHVVSFYAVDPTEKDRLAANLQDFSSHMPKSVAQRGSYMQL